MSAKLCVIGDSITGGVVYRDDAARYVKCRDSFVNLLGAELGLDVHNHSRFGCTSMAALSRLGRYEEDVAGCEYTLVMLGGNDSDFDWPEVARTPDEPHECNTPMGCFEEAYSKLLDRVAALGSRPIAMNLIPVFGRRYFKWFSKRADPEQLMRFLGTTDSIEHWNEMYSLAVMRVAASRGVPVLDARSAFLFRRVFDPMFSADGIHPSVEGHRKMYEFLLPQMRRILGAPSAAAC